jgi:rubrerythrin
MNMSRVGKEPVAIPPKVEVKQIGDKIEVNTYECSDCKHSYLFEQHPRPFFCPNCGVKYKFRTNISL